VEKGGKGSARRERDVKGREEKGKGREGSGRFALS